MRHQHACRVQGSLVPLVMHAGYLGLIIPLVSAAPFAFSATLGDHAVLQNPIVLWGSGTPNSCVAVTVTGGAAQVDLNTTVGPDGIWRQPLAAMDEGFTAYTISARSGAANAVLKDVLVGKTFLCSGQVSELLLLLLPPPPPHLPDKLVLPPLFLCTALRQSQI